jgi:hypothetical protein
MESFSVIKLCTTEYKWLHKEVYPVTSTKTRGLFVTIINACMASKKKLNPVAVVFKLTIPTERPPLVGEVSANLCEQRVLRGQRNEFTRPLISVF